MTTILAAIDDTQAARSVLSHTCAIKRALRFEARALHVGEPSDACTAFAGELDVAITFRPGEPAEGIIAAAGDPEVAMVVLALHGLPGRHVPGHTAIAVATQLTKPLVVVPPETQARTAPRRILFPLDGTEGVSRGVRPLISSCVAAGLEVVALHVFEPSTVPRFLDGSEDAAVWRDEFLARHCAEMGLRLETRTGPTIEALLDLAVQEDVDAIALGWRQDLSPERAQVVRHALTSAGRPVVLIPLPRQGASPDRRANQQP
ncbi:MAG: universal stress protein [Candidatus Nanopelagicales bacterium]